VAATVSPQADAGAASANTNLDWRSFAPPLAALAAIAAAGLALGHRPPTWLDIHLKPWVDSLYRWSQLHGDQNWLFRYVFTPFSDAVTWMTKTLLSLLRWIRWPGVLAVTGLVGWRTSGVRAASIGMLVLAGCGVLGFWDDTLITASIMLVAVAMSLVIGIPLGIWAGVSDRAERILRAFLDTAQVMPPYVYLLPLVVAFGIGIPPAVVATVIYAVPPAARLTSLGIREVAGTTTEAGLSFGCTRRQLLRKVQLPLARRAILLGINQVIMMAFGVVVIAAFVGTGGLGTDVLAGLQKVDVGAAFVPGLALVLVAVAIDRTTTGTSSGSKTRRALLIGVAGLLLVTLLARLLDLNTFPTGLHVNLAKPVNTANEWVGDHVRHSTQSFSDWLVIHVLTPFRDLLQHAAWWLIVLVATALGWRSGRWRLGALCGACMVGIASLAVWDLAMDTLSQVLVAVVLSVLVALPVGILAGRSPRVERLLRPLLDAAQVMPAFVYLVPVIALFNVGRVPGVIASVIYAIPPGIRLISLGMREVPHPPREAATSFGATSRQELLKVQLPLAARSMMLALNQVIMMVLAMVVVAALIGAGGLGLETIYGLTKKEIGRGMAGGLAIVLLAVVLDRVTQAWGTGSRPTRAVR
jgi:glycine betaine/proline transport system permease protein